MRPDGKKWWRLDYTHEGKRKTLSIGTYPDTGLSLARTKATKERELVAAGIDPSEARKTQKPSELKHRKSNAGWRKDYPWQTPHRDPAGVRIFPHEPAGTLTSPHGPMPGR